MENLTYLVITNIALVCFNTVILVMNLAILFWPKERGWKDTTEMKPSFIPLSKDYEKQARPKFKPVFKTDSESIAAWNKQHKKGGWGEPGEK